MEGNAPTPVVEQPTTQQSEVRPDHHIHRQPRDFSGRVNGAPRPGAPAAKTDAPEPAPEAPTRVKVKYKANGQDVEEELDHDTLAARLAREKGAYSKFEEASRLRKEAERIQQDFEAGLSNPAQFRARLEANFAKRGMDKHEAREEVRKLFAYGLSGILDEDDLSPEQRRLRELEARERQREEEEEGRRAEAARAEFGKKVEAKRQEFTQRISAAMQAAAKGGLPVDEESMRVMGRHLLASMRHGVGCTEAELVAVYEADLDAGVGSRLKGLSFTQLKERYPELVRTVHAGLREQRVKQPGVARPVPSVGASRPAEPEPLRIASDDFEAYQKAMNERRGR